MKAFLARLWPFVSRLAQTFRIAYARRPILNMMLAKIIGSTFLAVRLGREAIGRMAVRSNFRRLLRLGTAALGFGASLAVRSTAIVERVIGREAVKPTGKPSRALEPSATRRLFARFHSYVARERGALMLAALCMVGVTVAEVLRPWPLKLIFDGVLVPSHKSDAVTKTFTDALGSGDRLLGTSALAILAIAILGSAFAYAQTVLLAGAGRRVVTSIRLDLYRHIQRLSQSFHDTASAGDLLTRLTGDVRLVRDLLVTSIIYMIGRSLVLLATLTVMALMDWRLALVAVVVLPVLTVATALLSGRIRNAARRQRKTESRVTHVMAENLEQIRVIQAHAREAHESARFERESMSSAEGELVTTRLEAVMDRVVEIVLAVGTCLVIWFGVMRVRTGALSPGDLLVFTAYLAALHKPVRRLASLTGRLAKATACGERVLAILDREPEIVDRQDALDADLIRGHIEFENVDFGYGGRRDVLRKTSLTVRRGEMVALLSPSGSGKSTIAHLLLRFYEPVAGRILIDGHDIRNFKLTGLRERIAVLQQDAALFSASIRDNISYGRPDATDEEIVAAAKAACAHDFIEALPDGYDTVVGRRGATLSGGQRQRIAIARAVIRKSPIVILDEPFTGLDRNNEATVLSALRTLCAGRTAILITHDPAIAALADRSFDVREGRVVERGSGEEASSESGADARSLATAG